MNGCDSLPVRKLILHKKAPPNGRASHILTIIKLSIIANFTNSLLLYTFTLLHAVFLFSY